MNIDGYNFYFEKAGRSANQGAINSAEQHFEGSSAEEAVLRETGQNSIDARSGSGPVRMEFEVARMATSDIPGIEILCDHFDSVAEQTKGQAGHKRMQRAAELAREKEIMVLRISDFGTKGLAGSEQIKDSNSPLSALTRGAGSSGDDGERGGSFGIGSAVGPMASDLSTVLYTSLPADSSQTVFAAHSRLASHFDASGVRRNGDGFFTRLDAKDFEYVRPACRIGSFPERTEPGTDTYILGFRMAEDDPDLLNIRNAAIDNFMVAIHRGELEIKGLSKGDIWNLNSETLEGFARNSPEQLAFHRAIADPEPTVHESERFGRMSLHVNIDDSLKKSLHTITMRRPHMRIDQFRHTSISAKYAAVLICDDEKGNKLLRGLEPPEHNSWDPARDPLEGAAAVKELKSFVRKALQERVKLSLGDTVEIKGLSRFLPFEDVNVGREGQSLIPVTRGESSTEEASTVVGDPASTEVKRTERRTTPVNVRKPAVTSNSDEALEKGKDKGGAGTRKDSNTGMPGQGQEGHGASRLRAGKLRFRSWADDSGIGATIINVLLSSLDHVRGDLRLVALGPGGAPDTEYTLPIMAVKIHSRQGIKPIEFSGNTLKNLELDAGVAIRIEVSVPKGRRYRLGVE